ncbi:T9SS type A sorting domain-containing protein [Candidatus Latescibacterota bacterium]
MRCIIILLLIFTLFPSAIHAQTVLFQDDFEDENADDWYFKDGWQIITDDTNYVFEGQGHAWANPSLDYYFDTTFQAKFKLIEGGFHFNILFKGGRYLFPIHPDFIGFIDVDSQGNEVLNSSQNHTITVGEWYDVKVILDHAHMSLFLDDVLLFEYDDPNRSYLIGKLAFECIDHIYIDDILITSEMYTEQVTAWVRTGGPLGGIGYDVRIDPSNPDIIYVTDQWSGCHKSYDGGNTWHPKNEGITSRFGPTGDSIPIFCLTIDPNNPEIVWCGTLGMRGVYKSENKGEYWELKVNGIPDSGRLTFRCFTIQPGNSDIVYLGAEWGLHGDEIPEGQESASKGKIYKTSDGGENWLEVLDSNALVRTIIIDPVNTDIVYAATGIFDRDDINEEGIWKSTDAGTTWFNINEGITNLTIGDIEMHPDDPNILLAAAGRLNGFGGGPDAENGEVLRTTDGGLSWTRVIGGNRKPFTYIEIDETSHNIVYGAASDRGFFKSMNGGVTWYETIYNPPYINPGHIISIATHKDKPNWLITNSYGGGVFISEDGANSWRDASKGYTGCEITGLAVAYDNPLKIYTVARSSIFKSVDGGENWKGIGAMSSAYGHVPIGPLEMRSIVIHPSNSDIVLAGGASGDIFKTIDGGKSWKRVHNYRVNNIHPDVFNAISYSPSNPDIVYTGMSFWRSYITDRPYPFDPTIPSLGMLKSTDGGENWDFINNGLESTYKNINHIAIHPTNPDIVFIGTLNSGIYKTEDGGNNWSESSDGIIVPDVRAIVFDSSNYNILYAGCQRGSIYKSTDGGNNWQQISFGIDPEAAIRSIVMDPTNSQTIYAGDWLSGVYRSTNGGRTWFHINDGLRTRAVHKMAISSDGEYIYAGTQGEGVFRLVLEQAPPAVESVSPDNANSVRIAKGESREFSVTAHDLNNDPISYTWFVDSAVLTDVTTSNYLVNTETIGIGEHEIKVVLSDGTLSDSVSWKIQVTTKSPPTNFIVYDIPNENGHSHKLTWTLSEDDSNISHYTIFRSRNPELTDPVNIESFESQEALIAAEEITTILISTVQKGQDNFTDTSIPVDNVAYYYWLQAVSDDGSSVKVEAEYILTGIENNPYVFKVSAPFPNPFNPKTTIEYEIPSECKVKLVVYDILGKEVSVIQDGIMSAGVHISVWNGMNRKGNIVSSGIYIIKLKAGNNIKSKKVFLMK